MGSFVVFREKQLGALGMSGSRQQQRGGEQKVLFVHKSWAYKMAMQWQRYETGAVLVHYGYVN